VILQEIAQPENLPFTVALGLMMAIGFLLVIGMLLGMGSLSFLDEWADGHAMENLVDFGNGGPGEIGPIGAAFSWLNLGRVPLLASLIVFLFLYGFIGINLQAILSSVLEIRLPALLAGLGVFILAIPPLKLINAGLGKVIPKDETAAISRANFVGRVATITIGTATSSRPAEAKLKGPLGRTHYIMVRPDNPEESFTQGTEVLIVNKIDDRLFSVIEVTNANLTRKKELS
jgi:hypothetical protein